MILPGAISHLILPMVSWNLRSCPPANWACEGGMGVEAGLGGTPFRLSPPGPAHSHHRQCKFAHAVRLPRRPEARPASRTIAAIGRNHACSVRTLHFIRSHHATRTHRAFS